MAHIGGAFDERIALTITQESGGGGATSWRVSHDIEGQDAVEDVDDTSYDWWADQMQQFSGDNVYKMPVDQHELMALVAPRALLETGNTEYYLLSNGSNYVAARATQKIYRTLGIGDRFGFYIDGNHGHCATLPAENAPIQAYVDRFLLGQSDTNTDVEVYPNPADTTDYGYPIVVADGGYAYYFPKLDYSRGTAWWGSNDPQFPDNWNTGGTLQASLSNQPTFHPDNTPGLLSQGGWGESGLAVNPGDTLQAGYQFLLGGHHPAATVSLVGGANTDITVDVSCHYGTSYSLTIPLAPQSYTIPTDADSWMPSSTPSSRVFQGTASAPSGESPCVGGHVTNAYFTSMGGPTASAGHGNPGGPGFLTSDVTDPLLVRFQVVDSTSGRGTGFGPPVAIQWHPLRSANTVNQNPIAAP